MQLIPIMYNVYNEYSDKSLNFRRFVSTNNLLREHKTPVSNLTK